ncbi:MAG: hypothetical protein A2X18_00690 [Bacteroidetes bacterium GWF2_40_14]|nr:MAG: hypothetical protein A2X18_00690 [Bacteroidetes bacterium GWF2_40_14]
MNSIKDKYLKGTASDSEKEKMFKHLEGSPEERKDFIRRDIDRTMSGMPNNAAPEKMVSSMMSDIRRRRNYTFLYKIAAILSIPLVGILLYQYIHFSNKIKTLEQNAIAFSYIAPEQDSTTFQYTVNPGVKGLITLPDGSKVWLNSNSSIKCPQKFANRSRDLELYGEGYFIVESNEKWPMNIKTASGYTVKVTGTEFNLSSYSNDNVLKLTMVSGTVRLIKESDKSELEVKKLEEITVPVNKGVAVTEKNKANLYLNTSWKNGLLVFDNTPMNEVIKKMERWFGVKILVKDSTVLTNHLTGEFQSESIAQVLEYMKVTSNIKFTVKDKTYTLYEE